MLEISIVFIIMLVSRKLWVFFSISMVMVIGVFIMVVVSVVMLVSVVEVVLIIGMLVVMVSRLVNSVLIRVFMNSEVKNRLSWKLNFSEMFEVRYFRVSRLLI